MVGVLYVVYVRLGGHVVTSDALRRVVCVVLVLLVLWCVVLLRAFVVVDGVFEL